MQPIIAYTRVSTDDQGQSQFGLQSQSAAITSFAENNGYRIVRIFQDVASAKGDDALNRRPTLGSAVKEAKRRRCPLVIHRVDRLSREADELTNLVSNTGITVIAVVEGPLNAVTIAPHARRVEAETKMLSERTKAGIASAREAGVIFGNTKNLSVAQKRGAAANAALAQQRIGELKPILAEIESRAHTSKGVAEELNRLGILTPSRKPWTSANVRRVQKQIADLAAAKEGASVLAPKHAADDLAAAYKDDPEFGSW